MIDLKILHVAQEKVFADGVVKNGRIVNVHRREVYRGGVVIVGERIAVTDHGYVDCMKQVKMEPVLESV